MADKVFKPINRTIAGLPVGFTELTDPHGRVFLKQVVGGANILNIVPGRPSFVDGQYAEARHEALSGLVTSASPDTKEVNGNDHDGLWKDKGNVPRMNDVYYEVNPEDRKHSGVKAERDLRFYSFEMDFAEYRRILNVILNEVGSKMAGFSTMNVDKYMKMGDWWTEGLHFYMESSSSISESVSNDVSESSMEGQLKDAVMKAREAAFINNRSQRRADGFIEGNQTGSAIGNTVSSSMGYAQSAMGAMSAASGMDYNAMAASMNRINASEKINAGEFLMYPKIWKGSTFDRSYNFSFKFASPQGDPQSIFEYVYLPFFMLFALVCPRQVKPDSYKAPMIVRLDSPGYLTCDMGIVNNFSFVRGGSQNLWTRGGLPLCIEVTMSVVDLYPTMAVSSNMALLRQNIGLSGFLDNMCGLNIMHMNLPEHLRATIVGKLATYAGIGGTIQAKASDIFFNSMLRLVSPS
jgi:hypothetical protein